MYNIWIVINPEIGHDDPRFELVGPRNLPSESPLNFASTVKKWMDDLERKWPPEELCAWIENLKGEVCLMTYDQAVAIDHLDEARQHGIDVGDEVFQEQYEWMLTMANVAMGNGYAPKGSKVGSAS